MDVSDHNNSAIVEDDLDKITVKISTIKGMQKFDVNEVLIFLFIYCLYV